MCQTQGPRGRIPPMTHFYPACAMIWVVNSFWSTSIPPAIRVILLKCWLSCPGLIHQETHLKVWDNDTPKCFYFIKFFKFNLSVLLLNQTYVRQLLLQTIVYILSSTVSTMKLACPSGQESWFNDIFWVSKYTSFSLFKCHNTK